MRVSLDTARNLILALPSDSASPDPLIYRLGGPPLKLVVSGEPILPQLVGGNAPGRIEFVAKASVSGQIVVSGALDIAVIPAVEELQQLSLGEDWGAMAAVLLFGLETRMVSLLAQWRYRNGGETHWTSTPWVNLRLVGTLFPAVLVPGGVTLAGNIYIASITTYAGLAALDDAGIPPGTVVRIITANGESAWRAETDDLATDDAEQPTVVRPNVYHGRVWKKVAGL